MKPNSSKEHIDYIGFSSHKMYAPFGIGVLVGDKETFIKADPDYCGGGTIKFVTDNSVVWDEPPHKNEAGSPNVIGVVALISAIKMLKKIGMENVEEHEKELYDYAIENLSKIPNIKIYCDTSRNYEKISIIPFNVENMSHEAVANILSSKSGISLRSGCFCAQPYVQRLLNISSKEVEYYKNNPHISRPGIVRISFGLYNNYDEINILIETLKKL
jgi:selenocysteine lyase/cysteine desulfurase